MNRVFNVNQADFQKNVIQQSYETAVLVDFWAAWCGPCRMLGPVLERLAHDASNNVVLAKLNVDYNQPLAQKYNVSGIPAVKAFVNGRLVDEFVGALPEPQVRQFIAHVHQKATPQKKTATSPKQPQTSKGKLAKARQALKQGDGCTAQQLLQGQDGPLLTLATFVCSAQKGQLNGNSDMDIAYQQAAQAVMRREYSTALYNLLAILNQQRTYKQAHALMEGIFVLLGDDDPLVPAYRQQVKAVLG